MVNVPQGPDSSVSYTSETNHTKQVHAVTISCWCCSKFPLQKHSCKKSCFIFFTESNLKVMDNCLISLSFICQFLYYNSALRSINYICDAELNIQKMWDRKHPPNQMVESIQRPQKKLIVTDIWQGTKPKGSGLSDKIYLEVWRRKGRRVTQVNFRKETKYCISNLIYQKIQNKTISSTIHRKSKRERHY